MIRTSQELVKHFMVSKGYMPEPPELPVQIDAKLAEQRHDYLAEENREYLDAVLAGDLTATADALADQLYIVLGTAVAHGIDLQPVFDAVHRSNMTKQGVDPVTGKGSKGPDYVPPTREIAAELLKQITGLADAPDGELKITDETCFDCGCPQHDGPCPECGHHRLEPGRVLPFVAPDFVR